MSDTEEVRKLESNSDESEVEGRLRFPVVGIGSSAGGVEACTSLLKTLPSDLGMAYIFVPHLDPSRESAFREILARATPMHVAEVQEGTEVQPNHVYVIPRNCEMTISQRVLHLASREQPRTVNTTIDTFLRSLAADQGNNAIAVILSGTASDGTSGLAAIKSEGGITFAQDSSAKYDGMPGSAMAGGFVDFVLPPDGISNELSRIAQHPYVRGSVLEPEPVGETREAQMSHVFTILRRATKVDFSEYKPPTIGRRVARRMALHKIEKLKEYVTFLQRNRNEVNALYQDLLINVTSFFRDPEAFEALRNVIYPALLKQRANNTAPIRIWVPGCSTGEETYSHAISLIEYLGEERAEIPIQIFGTDLSENAIRRARAGLYKETIEADLSPIRLRRFFHKVDSGYQISKTVRDLCIFSTQNVFNDPPFSRIDLLSCRNVMIYLGQSLQRRVIPIFHYALNPGGFLMIGNTEGLLGSGAELFEMADKKQKIYHKKSVPTPVTFGFSVQNNEPNMEGEILSPPKNYLQSIIEALESTNEELQSANEEIQSGNEELQSTNEELQTSKEELESANEELHTVNEEMQHRNELLTQLNNDLTNLLNSVNLPMVMVGPDLSVRRFTPQAAKVLGLTATDVGRPITRLKLKTDVENLEQMMLDVISELRPKQYQIQDSDGNNFSLRLTPYRTADNRIEGVVLSVVDFEDTQKPEDTGSPTGRDKANRSKSRK